MALADAKISAKEAMIDSLNRYVNETLPLATLLHCVVWRVNALADGAVPQPPSEALVQSILNFVVTLQALLQPSFQQVDNAATEPAVWAVVEAFNPRSVAPPAAAGTAFYSTKLERRPGDPT